VEVAETADSFAPRLRAPVESIVALKGWWDCILRFTVFLQPAMAFAYSHVLPCLTILASRCMTRNQKAHVLRDVVD